MNKTDEQELRYPHVTFRKDSDGELEIELNVNDGERYQGRFLSAERARELAAFLTRAFP